MSTILPINSMYGVIISVSIAVAGVVGEKVAKRNKLNPEIYWGALFWTLIAGIVGARLYHVIDKIAYYYANPFQILMVWNGGLSILGALLLGTFALWTYLKINKQQKLIWFDLAGIVLPLAQTIGRWANYFNIELFGTPTSLPWGIYVPLQLRPDKYTLYNTFHPLFLYESLLNLCLFSALYKAGTSSTARYKPGYIFSLYLLGYGAIRLTLETLRISPWTLSGLNVAQIVSILMIGVGIAIQLRLHYEKSVITPHN